MLISSSGGLLLLLAVQGATPANDAKRLGRDDVEFASALSRKGYTDLAELMYGAIGRQPGAGGDNALRIQLLKLGDQELQADRAPDAMARAKLLAEVVTAKEAFVKSHEGTEVATEVLDGLPDLYRKVAERIAAAVDEGENSAEKDELRKYGRDMFDRAVSAVQDQIEKLEERKRAQDPANPDEDLATQYMIAKYNLARTRYFQGLMLGQDSDMQPLVLEAALKVLADFALDFSDQLICYEGYIYEGLCYKELQQPEKAVESFDAAIDVRSVFEPNNAGVYPVTPDVADVVSSAVLQKMLLLTETGDNAGAAAAGVDYYATIPEPHTALRGLAVLAQLAQTYKDLGDDKSLEETAKELVALDPNGPAGARGRELLQGGGGGGALGVYDTIKQAESAAGRGELDRAIAFCHEVLSSARGESAHDLGSRAGLLLGVMYIQKDQTHEAAVAWDSVAQRYPKGKDAPECLWRSIGAYIKLQPDNPTYYKQIVRERMADLVKAYPQSKYASMAAIIEGQQLEAEGQFAQAAATYERVAADSAAYEEAMFRSGNAWSRMAQAAVKKSGKSAEATQAVKQAEEKLLKARADLEAAAEGTLDIAQQEKLRGMAFGARVSLANLYLLDGVDRPADVLPLFERVETEFAGDDAKIATAGNFRLKALLKVGKVDEATRLLDNLIAKDPDARAVGSGAATLAQALDTKGAALRAKDPNSSEAESLWRKAASYYMLGVRGQLDGSEALRVDDLELIANRLFALALVFGDVPDDVQSFVDSASSRPDAAQLEQAARIYEMVLPLTPSYRTRINLARVLGFLGRWNEAASHYSELFSQQRFADLNAHMIDGEALRAKPELIFALLEWGVCERELGVRESDNSRLSRAADIFETLVKSTVEGTDLWWKAKYHQLRNMADRGNYDVADVGLRAVERSWPDYDGGKLRLAEKFKALQQELSGKVFRQEPAKTRQEPPKPK
jgi:tetratricopeptide (TPR) repeat protein